MIHAGILAGKCCREFWLTGGQTSPYLGADRCAKLFPFRRARSCEPIRKRNPTFAVGRWNADAYDEAVERLRAFRLAYRQRLESWRAGLRDAPFPPGTWLMRHRHRVVVEEPGMIAA